MKFLQIKPFYRMITKSKNVHNIYPESGIIFVHIPKTGGTSINNFLLNLENPTLSKKNKFKYYYYEELKRLKISSKHGKAKDYKKFIDDDTWNKSLKIASIRNPWDLMLSSYYWWLQFGNKFHRCRHMYNDISQMNFYEFLQSPYGSSMINDCIGNIEDWINDKNGKFILDGLIRLEYFEEDFKKVINKFNLNIKITTKLKKLNSTSHNTYREYYDEYSKKKIFERFKFIIEKYGYSF